MIFSTLDGYTKIEHIIWNSENNSKRDAFRVVMHVKNLDGNQFKQINFKLSSNIDIKRWVLCDSKNRIIKIQKSFLSVSRSSLKPEDQSFFDYIQGWYLIESRNLSHCIKDFFSIQLIELDSSLNIVTILQPWVEGKTLNNFWIYNRETKYIEPFVDFLLLFHQSSICIYDLSSSNVVIDDREKFWLIDFELIQDFGASPPEGVKPMLIDEEPILKPSVSPEFDFQLLFRMLYRLGVIETNIYNSLCSLTYSYNEIKSDILYILQQDGQKKNRSSTPIEVPETAQVSKEKTEKLLTVLVETTELNPKELPKDIKRTNFSKSKFVRTTILLFSMVLLLILFSLMLDRGWGNSTSSPYSEELMELFNEFEFSQNNANPKIEKYFQEHPDITHFDPRKVFWRAQNSHIKKSNRCDVSNELILEPNESKAKGLCPKPRDRDLGIALPINATNPEEKEKLLFQMVLHSLWGNLKCLASLTEAADHPTECKQYFAISMELLDGNYPDWVYIEAAIHLSTTARAMHLNWWFNKRPNHHFFLMHRSNYEKSCTKIYDRLVPIGQKRFYNFLFHALGHCIYFSKVGNQDTLKDWKEKAIHFLSIQSPIEFNRIRRQYILSSCHEIFDMSKRACMEKFTNEIEIQ